MKEFWVFGATKSVGIAITRKLAESNRVITFSRKKIQSSENIHQIIVDFNDAEKVNSVIQQQLTKSLPDGVIFCQRYRPDSENALSNIINGCTVELGPVISFVEHIRTISHEKQISIVLLTSSAGKLIHVDLPLYYHILKSNTICINEYISVHERQNKIRINCICLGEFLKYNLNEYKESEIAKFDIIRQYSFDAQIITMSDISGLIYFLVSSASSSITGQVLFMEGNLINIAQESLLRHNINTLLK